MILNLFKTLFAAISDIQCMDMENSDCMEGLQQVSSGVSSMLIYLGIAISVIFILLAAVPKYSFSLGFFNDVTIRRILFILGLCTSTYVLFTAYSACQVLCSLRSDGDLAWSNFSPLISLKFYISLVIYPVIFWLTAFCLNLFTSRRKLFTIFKSNNKIFGLF